MSEDQGRHIKSVNDFSLLGRSGLRVSSLCLGTMTFGSEWSWAWASARGAHSEAGY